MVRAMDQLTGPASAMARTLEHAMDQLTSPASAMARTIEQLTGPTSTLARTIEEFQRYDWAALSASLRVVVEELELDAELEEPFENVEEQIVDSGRNLAATLAALPLYAQMALVVGALHILDSATQLQAQMMGTEVPPGLVAATNLLFATVAFLILWMQHTEPPEKD
jgi:hypothetical protein